jgi:hypothetical protein
MSIDFMPYVFNAAENIWRIPAGCDTDDDLWRDKQGEKNRQSA